MALGAQFLEMLLSVAAGISPQRRFVEIFLQARDQGLLLRRRLKDPPPCRRDALVHPGIVQAGELPHVERGQLIALDAAGNSYFVGSANGGIWKTTNGGTSWSSVTNSVTDSFGNRITSAKPGVAVQVLGFSQTPIAGELVKRAKNEHEAREIIAGRKETRVDAADDAEREAAVGQGKGAAAGMSIEDLLKEFSWLKREDVLQAIAFAAGSIDNRIIPLKKAS